MSKNHTYMHYYPVPKGLEVYTPYCLDAWLSGSYVELDSVTAWQSVCYAQPFNFCGTFPFWLMGAIYTY